MKAEEVGERQFVILNLRLTLSEAEALGEWIATAKIVGIDSKNWGNLEEALFSDIDQEIGVACDYVRAHGGG